MAIDDNTSYELTGAQVKDLANKIKGKAADNTFVGATPAAPGSKGLVPEPQAGDSTKFLSGDGTWQTVPTVYNGALTIQQNGTTLDTFTANSSDNKTVNIQTITAETVAPAEEVGAITASMIDWSTFGNQTSYFDIGNIRVAFGSATLTDIASGAESQKSVSFGVSFRTAPIVTFTVASWVPVVFQVVSSASSSSFNAVVKHNFGSTLNISINWIAIGAKA